VSRGPDKAHHHTSTIWASVHHMTVPSQLDKDWGLFWVELLQLSSPLGTKGS
jgi:hypothetical protein